MFQKIGTSSLPESYLWIEPKVSGIIHSIPTFGRKLWLSRQGIWSRTCPQHQEMRGSRTFYQSKLGSVWKSLGANPPQFWRNLGRIAATITRIAFAFGCKIWCRLVFAQFFHRHFKSWQLWQPRGWAWVWWVFVTRPQRYVLLGPRRLRVFPFDGLSSRDRSIDFSNSIASKRIFFEKLGLWISCLWEVPRHFSSRHFWRSPERCQASYRQMALICIHGPRSSHRKSSQDEIKWSYHSHFWVILSAPEVSCKSFAPAPTIFRFPLVLFCGF